MGSRIRENPVSTFEVYVEVSHPGAYSSGPVLLRHFPVDYTEQETLQTVPKFCFPFSMDSEAINQVGHNFTFVLTDIESKQRFGFCRLSPGAQTCYCILSYLPWFEVFYKLLNILADYTVKGEESQWHELLVTLYSLPVPEPGVPVHLGMHSFFTVPDTRELPSIPENRNLTEYFVAVDVNNMLHLYASMLYERRILICCSKLSTLTACVHGAAAMLYPMHWQHVYIPVLPQHLLDYCCAPMPYLIGVHSSLMEKVGGMALDDAVILNVDTNTLESSYDDLQSLPNDVVSSLKSRLKKVSATTGDGVARAFLKSQASLFGSYRNALKFEPEEPITFHEETFVNHRSSAMRQFLQNAIQLQFFKQFIDGRLDLLNSGQGFSDIFEEEISMGEYGGSDKTYHQWLFTVKKGGGAIFNTMRTKANPAMKTVYKFAKDHARMGLKEVKSRLKQKEEAENGFSTGGSAVISDDSTTAFTSVSGAVKGEGHVDSCRPITVHFGQGWPPVLVKRPNSDACLQSSLDHSVRPTRHYTVFLSEDSSGDELHYNDDSISGFPDSFLLSVPFEWSPLPQPYRSLKEVELTEGSESHTAPPSPVTEKFSNVNLLGEIFGCQDEPDSQPIALTKSLEDLRTSRNSELQSKFTYQQMDLEAIENSQALPGLKMSSSYSRIPSAGPDRDSSVHVGTLGDAHSPSVSGSITVPRPHGRRTPEPGSVLVPPLSQARSKAAADGRTLSGGQEFRLALTRTTDEDSKRPPKTTEDHVDLISLLDPLSAPAQPSSSCTSHSTDPYHSLLPAAPPPFTLRPRVPLNPFAQGLQHYAPTVAGNPFGAVYVPQQRLHYPGAPPPQAFSTLPGLYRPQIPGSAMVPTISGLPQAAFPYPGSALPHPFTPNPVVCVRGQSPCAPSPAETESAARDSSRAEDPFGDLLPLNRPAAPQNQRADDLRKKWETFD